MDRDIFDILLVLLVFILGVIIGLIINSIRKERYSKLPPQGLSVVKRTPTHRPTLHYPRHFIEPYIPVKETVSPAILFDERRFVEEKKAPEGAWVCRKCGAADATLIHRKGCDKCYKD